MENTLDTQICELFELSHVQDERKRERIIQGRLIGLGHCQYCSRCGGSGHYSFNLMDGTRCYGCSGSGYNRQKITRKLIAAVQSDIASGKYAQYMADLRKRAEISKLAKNAQARVMEAWQASGVDKAYDWRKASGDGQDAFVANTFNNPMYACHERVSKLANEIDSLTWQIQNKVKDADEKAAAEALRDAKTLELAETTTAALAEIQSLTERLNAYLAESMVLVGDINDD